MGQNLYPMPGQAPRWLDALAAVCLRADAQDTRLGDLSEQYVRTHARVAAGLGAGPWASAVAHLAATLRYLAAAANVMLFARAVEPGLRLAEDGTASFIVLDLREKTMAMLRVALRRLALPAVLLVCSALLITNAVQVWQAWQQNEALVAQLQRARAESISQSIDNFTRDIEGQLGWVVQAQWANLPVEQRRFDYVRLLRQTIAVTELIQLDRNGHEQLNVSRLSMDVMGSDIDRSAEPAVKAALADRIYRGPVSLRKGTPYMTIAIAHGGRSAVTLAQVNLSPIGDAIKALRVGDAGYAYIVDGKGRLIMHADSKLAARQPDLSALPQVAAALATAPSEALVEGTAVDAGGAGAAVLSIHAAVPSLGWRVFVELPASEVRQQFWNAVIRGASLLGLGLVAALFAVLTALRPAVMPAALTRA